MIGTYISSTQFSVVGDQTILFTTKRKMRCDCGVDGIKYGTISTSTYTSVTIVTLTTDSDDLTSNLTTVEWSVCSLKALPLHNHSSEDEGGKCVMKFMIVVIADEAIGDGSNYTNFGTNGVLTSVGTARVLNAQWIDAGGIKAPGSHPAVEIAHGTLETPAWQFSNEGVVGNQKTISWNMKTESTMDRTVAPMILLGWSTSTVDPGDNSKKVKWQLEYLWRKLNEDTTIVAQETLTVLTIVSTTAEGLIVSTFTGIDLPDSDDICIHCRLTRLSADVQDTVEDSVELHGVCLEWTSNKLGSAIT